MHKASDGGAEASIPSSTKGKVPMDFSTPLMTISATEAALLKGFEASLHDTDPDMDFYVEDNQLLSSVFKRKGQKTKAKVDVKIDTKICKKSSKGKEKATMDDDVCDGLLSALLDPEMSPGDLECCYGPRRGRNKF